MIKVKNYLCMSIAKELSDKYNIKRWFVASDCKNLKLHIIKQSNNRGMMYLTQRIR